MKCTFTKNVIHKGIPYEVGSEYELTEADVKHINDNVGAGTVVPVGTTAPKQEVKEAPKEAPKAPETAAPEKQG